MSLKAEVQNLQAQISDQVCCLFLVDISHFKKLLCICLFDLPFLYPWLQTASQLALDLYQKR